MHRRQEKCQVGAANDFKREVITGVNQCLLCSIISRRHHALVSLRSSTTTTSSTTTFLLFFLHHHHHHHNISIVLGSAFDWLKQFSHAAPPISTTTQNWVVTQYGISALVFQTSFLRETRGGVAKCRLFSQVTSMKVRH